MIISCPQCGTAYDMPEGSAIAGRKVRCKACTEVWRVDAASITSMPIDELLQPDATEARGDAGQQVTSEMDTPAAGDWNDVTTSPASTRGRQPMSSTLRHRRLARQRSGFDDVEAALAAVRTAPTVEAAAPRDAAFFNASDTVSPAGVAQPDLDPAANKPQPGHPGHRFHEDESDHGHRVRDSLAAKIIGWVALAGGIAGLATFAILDANTVVRILPGAAPLYAALGSPVNVRGLEFSNLNYQWQLDERGRVIINISGQVRNVSHQSRAVPSVVFAFLDETGLELFDWATPMRSSVLLPGATAPFASIIPAPPDAVRKVEVRFAKPRR